MLISSSIFPPANLISEPLGALVCFGLYAVLKDRIGGTCCRHVHDTLQAFRLCRNRLLASSKDPRQVLDGLWVLLVFVPIVVITAVFNAIIVQILFYLQRVLTRGRR
jgi:energy-coupling factor transport system ATP-binding protein